MRSALSQFSQFICSASHSASCAIARQTSVEVLPRAENGCTADCADLVMLVRFLKDDEMIYAMNWLLNALVSPTVRPRTFR